MVKVLNIKTSDKMPSIGARIDQDPGRPRQRPEEEEKMGKRREKCGLEDNCQSTLMKRGLRRLVGVGACATR